jgi:MSHA biogenesis protein MshQ
MSGIPAVGKRGLHPFFRGMLFVMVAVLFVQNTAIAAITYFGSASNPADNGSLDVSPVVVTPPVGMQAGDLVILVANVREAGRTLTISATGGQAWTSETTNTTNTTQRIFWARYNGTWSANPSVANGGGGTNATTVVMHVFRPTASVNTWAIDVALTNSSFTAAAGGADKTITGINVVTPGALVLATWASTDNNTWGLQTAGWANAGGAQYRNQDGNDASQSAAYKVMPTAGASGNVVNRQLTAGTDAGNSAILAFREVPPVSVVSINCSVSCAATSAATVSWTVIFNQSVTGVDTTAFSIVASGLSGAFIASVTGSGTTWTVTANTGIGAGTLGLDQTGPGSVSPTLTGTFTGQVYTISATPALAEYRMDEAGWNGTAGEVVDTSGSYPGTAINSANTTDGSRAIPGNPGTCRYGVFDNGGTITQGYVALPGFPNLNTDFTITGWIRSTDITVGAQRILIDDETNTGGYGLSLGEGGTGILRFYARGSSVVVLDTPNVITNNTWYFVAGVADISNGVRRIYVFDALGNLVSSVSVASTGWGIDAGMASIGGETNASGEPTLANHFKGNIDELRVYPKVLSQSALTALATQTHACAVIVPTPGGFNAYETATAAGAVTGVIKTRIAGSTISLDMIALDTAKTAILTGFADTVRVEVLDSSDNSGALDANSCRSTWTTIQTLSPDPVFIAGDNGRKTISFTVPDAYGDVRLRITYPAGAPTTTGCSTDNFAIRPNAFVALSVSDADWVTAGITRTLDDVTFGSVTHKAGRPFRVSANAVNAAGAPAITTNYTGTPTATLSACAGVACTATFGALSLGTTFVSGQLASNVATYDNAGAFQLQLVDSSFAGVDASDTTGDCTAAGRYVCSASLAVGRFVPDHFAVSYNTPEFGTACSAGSFTYVGQTFNYRIAAVPVITVLAENAANNPTTLYSGSWWRITSGSLTGKSYTAASGALDTSGITGTDPVINDAGSGSGSLVFSSGTGLFFTRTTPVAPFDAELSLAINVIDADGVAYASNPARFGAASAGNGIAFSDGNVLTTNDKQMRFGRLRVGGNSGSQLLPLQVPFEAQYWTGAFFETNIADTCTTLVAANIGLGNYIGNLNAGETTVTAVISPLQAGRGRITLSAPGAGNNGSVDVAVNLGPDPNADACPAFAPAATAGDKDYLRGLWCTPPGTYTKDPAARARFGILRSSDEAIYNRENY